MSDPVFYGKPLTFNPRNHRYYWDGQPVPSVTTIISRLNKPLLIQWAANCAVEHIESAYHSNLGALPKDVWESAKKAHEVIRDTAGDVGTMVHDYARCALGNLPLPDTSEFPEQALKALRALGQWRGENKVEPIAVERRVMSRKLMVAGTCDYYGHINGRRACLDFKTGNGVYDEAWWQTSGYDDLLAEELDLGEPLDRWIIHLNKTTGECVPHLRNAREDHEQDRAVWRNLVALDAALRVARKHPQPKKKAA